ncbi:MAG: hypothetical protein ACPGVD_06795, partial [Flavobacteriales bacterium]
QKHPAFKNCENQNISKIESCFYKTIRELFFKEFKSPAIIDREKFKKLTNFSLDSMIKYSNNTFEFNLYGTEIKSDTSVQYEYDDDFNKVEKFKITQSVHPQFELNIPYQNNNLFHYLVDDSCIKKIDGMYVFTPYPFSKVHAAYGNGLSLFTSSNLQAQWSKFPTAISFIADFSEIDTNLLDQFGIRNRLLDNKSIKLSGVQKGDTTRISGALKFN